MSKSRLLNTIFGLAVSAGAAFLVWRSDKALQLGLMNATGETLKVHIGTDSHPRLLGWDAFLSGKEERISLKDLPLGEHTTIYIWLEGADGRSFQRTLLYDVDQVKGPLRALIVDYGNHYLDVKMVQQ